MNGDSMRGVGLDDLLAPYTVGQFISEYLGKKCLHLPGQRGRFANLLSWPALNSSLRHSAVQTNQLQMFRDGRWINPDSFIRVRSGHNVLDSRPVLLAAELTERLREGATLVIKRIDEIHEPIAALAERLEGRFRRKTQVNMHASCQPSMEFDIDVYDRDTFILQVDGGQDWRVFSRTPMLPLPNERERPHGPLTDDPVADIRLQEGDALYVPRGFRCAAVPYDVPTLHLTVGLATVTAVDMMLWLIDRLKMHGCMRVDVPRFADAETQDRYLSAVREAILDGWCDRNVLKDFLLYQDVTLEPRQVFGLPWSATPDLLPDREKYLVRVAAPRPLRVETNPETSSVEIAFNAKGYRYSEEVLPIFRYLDDHAPVLNTELYSHFRDLFGEDQLKEFLLDLASHGIIVCEAL